MKKALKAHKKEAVKTVKNLITELSLTKGDFRRQKTVLSESQKNQYIAYIERQMLYSYNNELKQLFKACSRQGLRVFNGTDDRASTDSGYRRT